VSRPDCSRRAELRRLCLSIVMLAVLGVLPARPLRAQNSIPVDAWRNDLHRVVDSHLEQLRQDSARVTAEVRFSVKGDLEVGANVVVKYREDDKIKFATSIEVKRAKRRTGSC